MQALSDVTVRFAGGTVTAVVGASGSGKSTLLQCAAIARALITSSPDVIFADEPTAALDVVPAESILGLLRQAASDPRRAVVIVTHDRFVASQADRVLVLDGGRIVTDLAAPDVATIVDILRRQGTR